jgi:hypothetical protein
MMEDANFSVHYSDSGEEKTAPEETGLYDENSESTLAGHETLILKRIRGGLFVICFLASAAISCAIYFSIRKGEEESFENQFEDRATKIIDSFHDSIQVKLGAVASFSIATTSYANFRNLTWPFVTLPDFHIQGLAARSLAESASITLYPFVEDDDREAWEEYTQKNLGWVDQGAAFDEQFMSRKHPETHRSLNAVVEVGSTTKTRHLHSSTASVSSRVYAFEDNEKVSSETKEKYFPHWQSSPVSAELVNFDIYSSEHFAGSIRKMWETQEAVVGRISDPSDPKTKSFFSHAWAHDSIDADEPASEMYFPVFDRLRKDKGRDSVGFLMAFLFWGSYFEGVLPPHTPVVSICRA